MPDHPPLEAGQSGSVSAPAGYGKTHCIVQLAAAATSKPLLVLTHTNAGVDAIRQRLAKDGVPASKVRLSTLDAWTQRIVRALPKRSEVDLNTLDEFDYPEFQAAVLRLIASGALDSALPATYSGVVIDEYQDCDLSQHSLAEALAARLPARVFGDYMQGIFDFDNATQLVQWTEVERVFPPLEPLRTPHRWKNAAPELGEWLHQARIDIEAGKPLDFSTGPKANVSWTDASGNQNEAEKTALALIRQKKGDRLFIVESVEAVRHAFARRHPGVMAIERADLPDLHRYARTFSQLPNRPDLTPIVEFAEATMTGVKELKLLKRTESLKLGRARNQASSVEQIALTILENPSADKIGRLYRELEGGSCRVFRPELYHSLRECLDDCRDLSSMEERAKSIQNRRRFGKRAPFSKSIGSTLLLKGLECEQALVLNADKLEARHLYVAMTRAKNYLVMHSKSATWANEP